MELNNMSDVFGGKVLGKKTGVDDKLKPKLPKTDIFDNVKGNALKADTYHNIKNNLSKVESKMLKNTVKRPEEIGWKRINKQKNLNLFGDKDKDKVLNVFDCKPYDKMKEGVVDKAKNLLSGQGWQDNVEVVRAVSPIEPPPEGTIVGRDLRAAGQGIASGAEKVGQFIGTGASHVWQASGIPQARDQRQQQRLWEQDIRTKARLQALEDIEGLKARGIYETEMRKQLERRGYPRGDLTQQALLAARGRPKVSGFRRGLDETQAAFRRSAGDFSSGIRAAAPTDIGMKINQLIGMGRGVSPGLGQMSALPGQPVQQVPQQDMSQGQLQYPQRGQPQVGGPTTPPPGPGMVWSEKSKRWVRYTRTPYQSRKGIPQMQPAPLAVVQQPQYY